MADMLLMSAIKVSNPVEAIIYMKIYDFTGCSSHSCLQRFHVKATTILRSISLESVMEGQVEQATYHLGRFRHDP